MFLVTYSVHPLLTIFSQYNHCLDIYFYNTEQHQTAPSIYDVNDESIIQFVNKLSIECRHGY